MRLLCLTERVVTPRRVGIGKGMDEEEDPEREVFKNLWVSDKRLSPYGRKEVCVWLCAGRKCWLCS